LVSSTLKLFAAAATVGCAVAAPGVTAALVSGMTVAGVAGSFGVGFMRRAEFVGVLEPGNDCGVVAWFVTAGAAVVPLVDDDELVDDDDVCANAGAAASAMAATPNIDAVSLGKVLMCAPPDCGYVAGAGGTRIEHADRRVETGAESRRGALSATGRNPMNRPYTSAAEPEKFSFDFGVRA